jgi:hypothetical protein
MRYRQNNFSIYSVSSDYEPQAQNISTMNSTSALILFLTTLLCITPSLAHPAFPSLVETIPTRSPSFPTAFPNQASTPSSAPGLLNGTDCDAHDKVYQAAKWMLIITFAEVNILGLFLAWKYVKGSAKPPPPPPPPPAAKKEG